MCRCGPAGNGVCAGFARQPAAREPGRVAPGPVLPSAAHTWRTPPAGPPHTLPG